jgi:hypothetical protein
MIRRVSRFALLQAVVSLSMIASATGLAPTPARAVVAPITQFVFSPSPMAPAASLSSGSTVAVTLTAKDATGAPVPNASVYLAISAATSTTPGSATSQGFTLTSVHADTLVTTDTNGQIAIAYTAGDATRGKDQIQAWNKATSPTAQAVVDYRYFAGSYTFTPNPMAPGSTLANGQTVSGKVCILNGAGAPTTGGTAWLKFTAAAGSDGSARAGNGTLVALTSTPQSFAADSQGCIPWSYTAPTTPPSIGFDAIQIQDAPDHVGIFQTDRYYFGGTFVSVNPARIVDSRIGLGLATSIGVGAGQSRSFHATGVGGVPAGAIAVTGNLTVTGQTAPGYVALSRTKPTTVPASSTINFPVGDNRANGVTAPLGITGLLWATYIAAPSTSKVHLVFDVTGYFAPDASGATYVPLEPARLLDSRSGNGLSGPFTVRVPRTFTVAGRGGVPGDAVAVTGNLTVTKQTAAGYVFLGPVATATPASSTLNFPLRDTRANGVTVPLSANGALSATYVSAVSTAQTHLLFDVTGYFAPDSSGATYVALTPTRLLDSRSGNGLSGPFTVRVPRTFTVAGRGAVPTNAVAVAGNLTVTQQTAAGYVFLGPVATATPTSSTLNFPLGDNRANGVTVSLSNTGTLSATYVSGVAAAQTHLVFDVTGYFR